MLLVLLSSGIWTSSQVSESLLNITVSALLLALSSPSSFWNKVSKFRGVVEYVSLTFYVLLIRVFKCSLSTMSIQNSSSIEQFISPNLTTYWPNPQKITVMVDGFWLQNLLHLKLTKQIQKYLPCGNCLVDQSINESNKRVQVTALLNYIFLFSVRFVYLIAFFILHVN